jgi:hypothetical protein
MSARRKVRSEASGSKGAQAKKTVKKSEARERKAARSAPARKSAEEPPGDPVRAIGKAFAARHLR